MCTCDEKHEGLPDAFYWIKNIVPGLIYRDLKFGFYIRLHCGRDYLKIENLKLQNLSSPTFFGYWLEK